MTEITFHQVESDVDRQQAAVLIREYLEWLNEYIHRHYNLDFDIEAMLKSDLSNRENFTPRPGVSILLTIKATSPEWAV
jgi:hypothetical protein